MPLSHASVSEVGNLLGFYYTQFDGQCLMPEDASDGVMTMSGKARLKLDGYGSRPPMLIFTGLVPGFHYNIPHDDCKSKDNHTKSVYVLNLNTMKPTKNSWRQLQIPEELAMRLRTEFHTAS